MQYNAINPAILFSHASMHRTYPGRAYICKQRAEAHLSPFRMSSAYISCFNRFAQLHDLFSVIPDRK